MMEMPIRLNVVIEPPELNIFGSSSSTIAAAIHDAVESELFGRGRQRRGGAGGDLAHVSRVPSRPIGRKVRISTMSRYGMIGAICAMVTPQMSASQVEA